MAQSCQKGSMKNVKKEAAYFLEHLSELYPNAAIELNYDPSDNWQLLVVVLLSAQTTDKKVNQISPALFKRFKTVYDFAQAEPTEIEPYIAQLGLFRSKAKHLVLAAKKVVSSFGGHIPKSRDELESLAGVGTKTSAVIVANAFDEPAIAVDTHVARVSQRLGLSHEKDPNRIEKELTALFPKNKLKVAHHVLILHGRRLCLARKPRCTQCPVVERCPRIEVVNYQ
jgi:endonuclease-3